MLPRLIDFSERLSQISGDRIPEYSKFISNMRNQALQEESYWTFDFKIVSKENAGLLCQKYPDVMVSEEWRLVGFLLDIMSLAQLVGYTYLHSGREVVLPGISPEESYWIQLLKMTRLKPELRNGEMSKVRLWKTGRLCCHRKRRATKARLLGLSSIPSVQI